jgi:serine/threonine-protein kinase HipA
VLSVAEYFNLDLASARAMIKSVATATATWRDVALALHASPGEIRRMESAFEHAELRRALAL